MFVTLKMLLHTLLLPPAGPLLLAAAGAWLIARGRRGGGAYPAGWALLGAGLAFLWVLATPVIADALSHAAQRYPALDPARLPGAQAIVILGGDRPRATAPEYQGEPAVSGRLLERVAYGAYLARRTGLPVLVSGALESPGMRATLVRNFGVQPRWVEGRSRDTFENAAFSAPILKAAGVSRIVLVTDAEHEWRAVHEFASAGLSVVPAPQGVWAPARRTFLGYLPNASALEESTAALYELLGDRARRVLAALGLRRQAS
jgi:uncharacterized SAM-binding protein YcdF (DUF218 family)